MMMTAKRLHNLPPYLFAQIEEKMAAARAQGIDLINLGIGDPDLPTPDHVIARLAEEAKDPAHHRYPTSAGMPEYRQAVADYYLRRFGVELDPKDEVVSLIGSKEGIAHISLAYVDPGDIGLVPDPGYPVYSAGIGLAGGEVYSIPLLADRGFLPDLGAIPSEVADRAAVLFLNYPNNPTGAVATREFFAEAVEFAKDHKILICHDLAYGDVAFGDTLPPSFLEIPGAKDIAIEFGSVSKTYQMTGWRIGWAVGNPQAIEALRRLKTHMDSGQFEPIQEAAIAALTGPQAGLHQVLDVYRSRRDLVIGSLQELGWPINPPEATIYIWAPVPPGYTSMEFSSEVLEKTGVVITPGMGYGQMGEGYFRISLTTPNVMLAEALKRWKEHGIRYEGR